MYKNLTIILSALALPVFAEGESTGAEEEAASTEEYTEEYNVNENGVDSEAEEYPPEPSFSCSASDLNPVERTICQSPDLMVLDNELNDSYQRWMNSLDPERSTIFTDIKPRIEEDQMRWLADRDACPEGDVDCISELYFQRINHLSEPLLWVTDYETESPGLIKNETSTKEMRSFSFVKPNNIKSVSVETKLMNSPLRSIQKEIVSSFAIDTNWEECGEEAQCELDRTFTALEVTPDLWVLTEFNYEYTGGAHGGYGSTTSWIDVKNDQKLAFSDLFEPANLEALKVVLQTEVLKAIRIIDSNEGGDVAWEDIDTQLENMSLSSWNYLDIVPELSESGQFTNFLVTGGSYAFGSYASSGLFEGMPIPMQPFVPLMKPEFQAIFGGQG